MLVWNAATARSTECSRCPGGTAAPLACRAPARTALFKAVGRNEWLARRTLFAAARRDVTAEPRELSIPVEALPIYPLIH
jgi:hypothetical protein